MRGGIMRLSLYCFGLCLFFSLHSMEEDTNSSLNATNTLPLLITSEGIVLNHSNNINDTPGRSFIERISGFISWRSNQSAQQIPIGEKRRLLVEYYITKSDYIKMRSLFAFQKSQILENNSDYQRYFRCADQILKERENEVAKKDIPWLRFVPFIVLSISSLGLTLEALTIDNSTGTWPWQLRMALGLATTGGIFMHGMKTLFPTWSEYNHLQAQCIMNLIKANQPQEEPH